jgi:hypothetical protein
VLANRQRSRKFNLLYHRKRRLIDIYNEEVRITVTLYYLDQDPRTTKEEIDGHATNILTKVLRDVPVDEEPPTPETDARVDRIIADYLHRNLR